MFSLARKAKLVFFIGILSLCVFSLFTFFLIPRETSAQANTAISADASCISECQAFQKQAYSTNPPQPQLQCIPLGATSLFCQSPSSGGSATGHCEMTGCKATAAAGVGGSGNSLGSLGQLASAVGQLLGQLMSAGSGSGSSAATTPAAGTTGCVSSYYAESTTPAPTDPCAYYVAPGGTAVSASTTDTSAQDLLNALNGTTGADVLNELSGSTTGTSIDNTNTNTNTNLNSDVTTANVTGNFNPNNPANQQVATNTAGLSGSIETTPTGATFVTNQIQGNTETSSFLGGDGISGFVSTLIGGWCTSRPWATGFIASIIPPSFFDGLCQTNGFTVGTAVPSATNAAVTQTAVTLTQTPVQQASSQPSSQSAVQQTVAPSNSVIPGRVDIWAVPPSVALGSRTTIFWNTENVTNCTETSPDGSFSQTSLSGGAATVPLTEATTFTISCLDSGGNPTTDYVTVNISG